MILKKIQYKYKQKFWKLQARISTKLEFQQNLTECRQNRDFSKLTPENTEEFAKGPRRD